MKQNLEVMEERYYGRMFDRYNETPRCEDRPDYNPKVRKHALDDLLEFISGDIEMLNDFSRSACPEKRQVFRDYDGLLAELRKYAEMLRSDCIEADYEYRKNESYWDSLDD